MGAKQTVHPVKLALVNAFGGLMFGYVGFGIATPTDLVWKCWYSMTSSSARDAWLISALHAITYVGAGISAVAGGPLVDQIGMRKGLLLSGLVGLGAVASIAGTTLGLQFVARFICGLGIGLSCNCCTCYVSDMSPHKYRGVLGSLYAGFITFGIFIGGLMGYVVLGKHRDEEDQQYCSNFRLEGITQLNHDMFWKNFWLTGPGCLPALALLLLSLSLPEIPQQQKPAEAGEGEEEGRIPVLPPHTHTTVLLDKAAVDKRAGWKLLFKHPKALVIGVVMAVALIFTGEPAVWNYAPMYFKTANISQVRFAIVLLQAYNWVVTCSVACVADKLGRRSLLIPGLLLMGVSLTLLAYPLSDLPETSALRRFASITMIATFLFGFNMGIGTLFFVVVSEIYESEVMLVANGIMNACQWFFMAILTLLFPPLNDVLHDKVFLLLAVPCYFGAIFLALLLPETKNRSAEHIAKGLKSVWIVWPRKTISDTVPINA